MKVLLFITLTFLTYTNANAQFGPFNDVVEGDIYNPYALIPFDLDSDGDMDIIVNGLFYIFWIENLGDGSFSFANEIYSGEEFFDFDVSDFDMDGDYDIILTDPYLFLTGNLYMIENLGAEVFATEPTELTELDEVTEFEVVDYDGDGDPDIVGLNGTDIIWFEADGTGAIIDEHVLETGVVDVMDFIVADIDNDLDIDVIWSSHLPGGFVYFIENLGGAVYDDRVIVDSGMQYPNSILAADIDGDSDLDIVHGSWTVDAGHIYWNENTGDGLFAAGILISDFTDGETFIAAGDTDLDGDIDIVATSRDDDKVYAFKNLGAGVFELDELLADNINLVNDIALADFEGDGDLDVFTLGDSPAKVGWFENGAINPHHVEGRLYYDENENGIMDDTEVGLPWTSVISDPDGTMAVTNGEGFYEINFLGMADGDYEILPNLAYWSITSAHETYDIEVSDDFVYMDTLDFGLFPDEVIDSIGTDLSGGFTLRCNLTLGLWLSVSNAGTTLPSGVMHLELDDSLAYVSAEFAPDSIDGQNIYWSYDDLFFFDVETFWVNVFTPDGVDDTVTSVLTSTIIDDGVIVYTTTDVITQPVDCAYDPNDKTPDPFGAGPEGNIPTSTDWIEYTVRFQNTGTDYAEDVVIRDQLDENLIWTSIQPLYSSHDMTFEFNPDGEVAFVFNDIYLPDSNASEIESHGFVKYRIQLKPDLAIGTTIENTAHIYFDFNAAVLTNTALNTISDMSDVSVESLPAPNGVIVYPNPTSDFVNIIINQDMSSGYSVSLVNLMGQEVYSDSNLSAEKMTIQTSDFESGVYILRVTYGEDQSMVYTTKLIIE